MSSLELRTHRPGEPPVWPDLANAAVIHERANDWGAVVIVEGMGSGRAAVAMRIPVTDVPTPTTLLIEVPLAHLPAIVIAARAAVPDEFAGGPLDPLTAPAIPEDLARQIDQALRGALGNDHPEAGA